MYKPDSRNKVIVVRQTESHGGNKPKEILKMNLRPATLALWAVSVAAGAALAVTLTTRDPQTITMTEPSIVEAVTITVTEAATTLPSILLVSVPETTTTAGTPAAEPVAKATVVTVAPTAAARALPTTTARDEDPVTNVSQVRQIVREEIATTTVPSSTTRLVTTTSARPVTIPTSAPTTTIDARPLNCSLQDGRNGTLVNDVCVPVTR